MAADKTLIEGAYRAAKTDSTGGYSRGMAKSAMAGKIIGSVTDMITGIKENRKAQWKQAISNKKNRGDSQSDEQRESTYKYAYLFQNDFINGTPKQKEQALIDLRKHKVHLDNYNGLMDEWTAIDGDPELDGNNFQRLITDSPYSEDIVRIMNGAEADHVDKNGFYYNVNNPNWEEDYKNTQATAKDERAILIRQLDKIKKGIFPTESGGQDRTIGTRIKGKLPSKQKRAIKNRIKELEEIINTPPSKTKRMSLADIQTLVNDHTFDNASSQVFDALRLKYEKLGTDGKDFESSLATVKEDVGNLISKGKTNSLIYDEFIPGRNFYDDLQEDLRDKSYGELGITEDMLTGIDEASDAIDINDGIDENEAKLIADELLKDGDLTKNYLTEYFTTFYKNNWVAPANNNNQNNNNQNNNNQNNNQNNQNNRENDYTSFGSFDAAFKAARKKLGKNQTFWWKGKEYTTNYASNLVTPGTYGPEK